MNYDRYVELLEIVTVVGDPAEQKRAYKFPLTATELLSQDNAKIEEYFLPPNRVVV